MRPLALLLLPLLVPQLLGCARPVPEPDPGPERTVTATPVPTSTAPEGAAPRVVRVAARGLDTPWGLAFLPDGTAVVTERDSGRVLLVNDSGTREIGTIRQVSSETDEAGLLGVAVSPTFDRDRRLWFYVTSDEDNRVVTATYDGRRLGPVRPVLTGIPKGAIHDGGRLVFGPDGFLYVSTGETGIGELAADPASLAGKILRITRSGKPAPENPDPESPVWTLGHRNVQGLAFDAEGRLWASEFGADALDELNLIEAGNDYGWPAVEGPGEGFTDPHLVWQTSEASPSGLAFGDGKLWMAALRGERLWRVTVEDGRATAPQAFFLGEYGRMRSVAVAPDGRLWVTTSNRDGRGDPAAQDDRILVVAP